ncbi:MAG: DUF177 domain-containing protein [Chloroflexota bacterium]|nr:MAG: DUF177 domain-containing protein [Chloroflexota bacterium]
MRFNVANLLQEDVGETSTVSFEVAPDAFDEALGLIDPVVGQARLLRTNRGLLADMRLTTRARLPCSRCLADVIIPISGRTIDEFFPVVDLRTGARVAVEEEAEGFPLTESHELDFAEPARQVIYLEIPMQPLCAPECAGLCPRCGHNLNTSRCACSFEPADARLSPLAQWLRADADS